MRYLGSLLLLSLVLTSCDPSDSELKSDTDRVAKLEERSNAIHALLTQELRAKYPADEGSVWTETRLALEPDWIVQTPEGLWGIDKETLAVPLDCDPKLESCEPTFRRSYCEVDSDCSGVARCEPMDALILSPGDEAPKLCLGRGDRLINRVYKLMVSADEELDLASLSLPTGRFRTGIVNALTYLSQKPSVPKVRFLFSGAVSALPEFLYPAKNALKDLMKEVEAKSSLAYKLHVNLAWLSPGDLSWNHAKIIVADGDHALSGGHNLWDEDYLSDKPVFDLSMEYRGEGAKASRDFLNTLWSKVTKMPAVYPEGYGRLEPFSLESVTQGKVRALSLGRLGKLGSNPSDSALKSLIDSAENFVLIDQQDLYNQIFSPLTQTFVFENIVTAAARGVQVQIVQSNKFPFLQGYGYVDGKDTYKSLIDRLSARLILIYGLSQDEAKQKACATLHLASFRFSEGIDTWPYKNSTIGNHTKMVMVDDAAFYLGSHNLYPANLQEFGFIVTDPRVTAELRAQYWDKVWAASGPGALACPK